MEVENWKPRPGQVWIANQKMRSKDLAIGLLRRNDLVGFLAWIIAKMTAWLFWAGPVLFMATLLALPLILFCCLLLLPLRAIARLMKPLSPRPSDGLRAIQVWALNFLEDYTEASLELAFRVDEKIERLSFF